MAVRSTQHTWHKHYIKLNKNNCENNNYIVRRNSTTSRHSREPTRSTLYGIITIIVIACYLNSINGELVHDDIFAIKGNADVSGGSPLAEVFANDFWGKSILDNTSHKSYRPLCVLSFRLNHALHGLNPMGYHLGNIGIHIITTLLFTYVCDTIVFTGEDDFRLAASAGVLFSVHPVHTEAVAGIVGRADVLAAVFFLLALIFYTRSANNHQDGCLAETRSTIHLLFSITFACLAMLVKEHGITVLGVCLVLDLLSWNRHICQRLLFEKKIDREVFALIKRAAITSFTLVFAVAWRLSLNGGQEPAFTEQDNPASFSPYLSTRIMSYAYLLVVNGWLLVCPSVLSYDWQMGTIPLVESLADCRNLASLAILILILFTSIRCLISQDADRHRLVSGMAMLIIPFLPACNIFLRVGFVVAERILYIPSMGYIIIFVQCLNEMRRYVATLEAHWWTLLLLLGTLWGTKTIVRNNDWQSRETLFRSGLVTFPHNAKMHYNYANLLKDTGQYQQAIEHYQTTLSLWPDHASAHNNLGTLLLNVTRQENHYREAIRLNPLHARAHYNLANTLSQNGNTDEAIVYMKRAVQLDSSNSDLHVALGSLLLNSGRLKEAEEHYQRGIELNPQDANAYNNLGAYLEKQNRTEEAEVAYRTALEHQPEHHVAMINLARLMKAVGRLHEAYTLFDRSLMLSRDVETLDAVGVAFFTSGRTNDAMALFKEAMYKEPLRQEATFHYAQVLGSIGEYEESERLLEEVLRLKPDNVEVLHQLSNIYGLTGKHKQAIGCLDRAIEMTPDGDQLAEYYTEHGNHHKDLGDYNNALQSYTKAVKLNPQIGSAHLSLGVIYHLQSDFNQALYHYTAARDLLPGNTLVLENINKLEHARKTKRRR